MKRQYDAILILFLWLIFSGFSPGKTIGAETTVCVDLKSTINFGTNSISNKSSIILLQDFLRAQGYFTQASTGYFGPMTFKAVQSFQTAHHLMAVGSVGPLTRAEIKKASCTLPVSPPLSQIQTTTTTVKPEEQVAQIITAPKKNSGKLLPYRADSFSDWRGAWGSVATTSSGTLLIKGTQTESSAEAFFPGSSEWTDYKYTASVSVSNGNIMLISRRVDDNNLLFCTFSGNIIEIQERIDGETTTVASTVVTDMSSSPYFQKALTVAMRVKGNTVGCSALGSEDNVTYNNVNSRLLKGGIAIETWFEVFGAATLELYNVNVEAI